jgi:hypothetical protein
MTLEMIRHATDGPIATIALDRPDPLDVASGSNAAVLRWLFARCA